MAAPRDYRDRTVLVTGAAGGLGSALCRCFAAAGAKVVAVDLDGARAEALAAALRARGAAALGLAADVGDEAACRAAVARAVEAFGGIDVLVNNAGISARCLLRDAVPAVARQVMTVNFFGALHMTQAALASLVERRGQIVVISSIAGFSPLVGRTAYAASKHALHGFFDSLRSELRGDGVDVMLACPSFVATGIERAALGGDGRPAAAPRRTSGGEAQPVAAAARIVRDARARRRLCLPAATARAAWWLSRLAPRSYE
ncbi:MAG: SDR family oxidoreductase, partial [Burkholderiales bacterium]|nr:SDR family oxidoreductase [Burkholderiales bacterium]